MVGDITWAYALGGFGLLALDGGRVALLFVSPAEHQRYVHELVATIALGLFALEVAIAHVWLRYFRFGPLEWVWRSLAYMKRQPMRV